METEQFLGRLAHSLVIIPTTHSTLLRKEESYLFVVYLTMLSAAQTTKCLLVWWLMNNNVERKFTEKVLPKFLETALEIGNTDEKNH